jgi:formate hydrogenlyase subunit 3/multisubunit Na+/H+ antiporter MnhD subunit
MATSISTFSSFGLYQAAVAILLAGAVLPLAAGRNNRFATILGGSAAMTGAGFGLLGAFLALGSGAVHSGQLAWASGGLNLCLRLDGLAAFFLVPIFLLIGSGALYAIGYLHLPDHSYQGGRHWFCFNLLGASMVLVVGAADILLFLLAWELMSLSSFLLVIYDLGDEPSRRAGWTYLVATHLGAAFLFFLFFQAYQLSGSTEFAAFQVLGALSPAGAGLFFFLALVGFGTKAGLFPLHSWLPEAHSAAPSHISALMSGVMVKTAVYAFLRLLTFLPPLPPWCGLLLAGLGLAGALFGIALATMQNDLKRSLAYSTVENIGLIFFGLGLWLYCRDSRLATAATLVLAGALLHVWNHALFKSLLFFGAGSILHATGTREISRLGGLLQRMPHTALLLMVGGGSIAALPPLNGLISEWLLYLGLFEAGQGSGGGQVFLFMLFIILLATVGALVLLALTRILGIALSGEPRSPESRAARESGPAMLAAMTISALLCLAVGILPGAVLRLLIGPLQNLAPAAAAGWPDLLAGLPFGPAWSWSALGLSAVLALLVGWRYRRRSVDLDRSTWGCGFLLPASRMSYTAGGYGQLAQEEIYCGCLRPRISGERPPLLFPVLWHWRTRIADPVLARILTPLFGRLAELAGTWRRLQGGHLNLYLTYFFAATILLLGWTVFS